jgi:hypothetical protein
MDDRLLVGELSLRANVPETAATAVLDALRDLVRQGHVSEDVLWPSFCCDGPTDPRAVDELIAAARAHPLGIDFLRHGFLGSVAAEFRAHAFTVEAARERLSGETHSGADAEVAGCR